MKKFKWVAEITVDKTWVTDGFNLTAERLHEMMQNDLPFAYPHEIRTKILTKPLAREIKIAQGILPERKNGKEKSYRSDKT